MRPAIVEKVLETVDTLVPRFGAPAGRPWTRKEVRKQLRFTLPRFSLPPTGELYDRAYDYISENY